ncbi:MAG: hypothetical protein ACYCYO_00455 [Bacilli bacterium]
MSKTTSQRLLQHYSPLHDIPDDEWEDFFPPGRGWTPEDDEYLLTWYGRESVISLAYALGKEPWKVRERACLLRMRRQLMQSSKRSESVCNDAGSVNRPTRKT